MNIVQQQRPWVCCCVVVVSIFAVRDLYHLAHLYFNRRMHESWMLCSVAACLLLYFYRTANPPSYLIPHNLPLDSTQHIPYSDPLSLSPFPYSLTQADLVLQSPSASYCTSRSPRPFFDACCTRQHEGSVAKVGRDKMSQGEPEGAGESSLLCPFSLTVSDVPMTGVVSVFVPLINIGITTQKRMIGLFFCSC